MLSFPNAGLCQHLNYCRFWPYLQFFWRVFSTNILGLDLDIFKIFVSPARRCCGVGLRGFGRAIAFTACPLARSSSILLADWLARLACWMPRLVAVRAGDWRIGAGGQFPHTHRLTPRNRPFCPRNGSITVQYRPETSRKGWC